MKKIASALTVLLVAMLASGTVFEKLYGPAFAQRYVYHAPYFIALWALLAVAAVWGLVRSGAWRRLPVLALHSAFGLILIGALVTHCFGLFGSVTLQPGVAQQRFVDESDPSVSHEMPFALTLQQFEVVTYPGTDSPMDYVSTVAVADAQGQQLVADISMNNILKYRHYRFYQSDYDADGGSTLSVSHDPWGIGITYTGYALLLLALIGLLVERQGGFRRLLREVGGGRVAALLVLLWLGGAAEAAPRTLPRESADRMGQMYVLYRGRVCPLQTLAKDFTTKICGSAHYAGLTPEQVLSGWIFYYDDWSQEPMFKIKGGYVRDALGLEGRRARLVDFVDDRGQRKLDSLIRALPMGDARAKKYRAADEKYQLIAMLYGGELLRIFPYVDSTGVANWYSQSDKLPLEMPDDVFLFIRKQLAYCQELVLSGDFEGLNYTFEKTRLFQQRQADGLLPSEGRVRAERLYNRMTAGKWLAMVSITLGLVGFALYLFGNGRRRLTAVVRTVGVVWMAALSLFLLLLFVLRWVAGGHVPMAGSYDTMNLLALIVGVATLCGVRRYGMVLPIGMLMSGLVLLVAMMGGANPPVTHLMPVLSSPLLSLHVTVIMMSYALLFFIMVNGVGALALQAFGRDATQQVAHMRQVSLLMLYPAVALLTVGIFIGAVWANVSWGNYWSWDPKEVWALITLFVYAAPLHERLLPALQKPVTFHIYCVVAFLSVLVTYFGVNMLLGGAHAYN
ncbi:MAG: cytochrome c biogenesis protein CcsA [Bacteroidales bacterium]|nr:cytochrome c biogenesis protein CcsA [Bacteroidales bacterium]